MDIKLSPCKLAGDVMAVSSKSYAHRQITAAMLCKSKTEIQINGFSDDIMRTLSCVKSLGGDYEIKDNKVIITPALNHCAAAVLNCGESGTTARIMLPVCAAFRNSAVLTGEGRLPERPFGEITKVLREHGSSITSDSLPIEVSGKITGGDFRIPGHISSQYITGLMLALPLLEDDSTITLTTELKSSGYVDITIDVLRSFGINITKTGSGYKVPAGTYKTPRALASEGDWSNAAFWVVANALGSKINISNLNLDSVQGDKIITQILEDTKIDVDPVPDLFPVLAVLAAGRCGKTRLYNAARLRLKESDRIESVASMLKSLGCKTDSGEDYLEVYGTGALSGGTVDSFNDHRIVMAASVASLICKGDVIIKGAQAVNKSYPTFFEEFKRLGGIVNVL